MKLGISGKEKMAYLPLPPQQCGWRLLARPPTVSPRRPHVGR